MIRIPHALSGLKSWPKVASFSLAVVPVIALVFIVVSLVVGSVPAITPLGIGGVTFTRLVPVDEPTSVSLMTITTAADARVGSHPITIIGTSAGGEVRRVTFNLEVHPPFDFWLAVEPAAATVTQGDDLTVAVTAAHEGMTEEVTLTAELPAGVEGITVTLVPAVGEPGFRSTMIIAVAADATVGEHLITIIGMSEGNEMRTAGFTLRVEEASPLGFGLAVEPIAAAGTRGEGVNGATGVSHGEGVTAATAVTHGEGVAAASTVTRLAGITVEPTLIQGLPAHRGNPSTQTIDEALPFDFTLRVSPGRAAIIQGERVIVAITATRLAGISEEVTLTHDLPTEVGWRELFGTEFACIFLVGPERVTYGLLPALWGTFLVVVIAIAIALPVSLAMAVFASEFPLGFLGRGMRAMLGVLSGIPPVVYGVGGAAFIRLLIIPNFGGFFYHHPTHGAAATQLGISPEEFPPPGLPWAEMSPLPLGGSTLLGGMVLALLIIPFVAPLLHDAIENVSNELKEASLALGANRWHTLTALILPMALSGIIAATALGALKAIGDVMIVSMLGGDGWGLHYPLWDILAGTSTLATIGARLGLAGGETALAVANFGGLMLLVMAFATMGLVAFLQRRFKRRFSS